jgi:hypothetical protein
VWSPLIRKFLKDSDTGTPAKELIFKIQVLFCRKSFFIHPKTKFCSKRKSFPEMKLLI